MGKILEHFRDDITGHTKSKSQDGQSIKRSAAPEENSLFDKFRSVFVPRNEIVANTDHPTFVILPLYIYPTETAWEGIFKSIQANPNLNFSIVVNPSDGPGAPPYPVPEYITGISQLNAYPNVQLHGYVHTTEATRSQIDVMADIKVYAGWKNYADADIHMAGIFFDEAPSTWTQTAFDYMENVTRYAKTIMGPGFNNVIFNPGVLADCRYYDIADTINAFENYHSAYISSSTAAGVPAAYRSRSTAMIHGYKGSTEDLGSLVQDLIVSGGWQGLFISDQEEYSMASTKWDSFCGEMNAV